MERGETTLHKEVSQADLYARTAMSQRSISAPNVLHLGKGLYNTQSTPKNTQIQRNKSLPNMILEQVGNESNFSVLSSKKITIPVNPWQWEQAEPKRVSTKTNRDKASKNSTTTSTYNRTPSVTLSGGSLCYSNVVSQQIVAHSFKSQSKRTCKKSTVEMHQYISSTKKCSCACIAGIFTMIVASVVFFSVLTEAYGQRPGC